MKEKFAAICTAISIALPIMQPALAYAQQDSISICIDGEYTELSVEPYTNESGVMLDAREVTECFGLEYSVDEENKAFTIFDDIHGSIVLMHNATTFVSGDEIYECDPFFCFENGIPMVELGFYSRMFNSSYEYIEDDNSLHIYRGVIADEVPEVNFSEETANLAESGSVHGTLSIENDTASESDLDVTLYLKTAKTIKRYMLYKTLEYVVTGDTHELGDVVLNKGESSVGFSFDIPDSQSKEYPKYTVFYDTDSEQVEPVGYYGNDEMPYQLEYGTDAEIAIEMPLYGKYRGTCGDNATWVFDPLEATITISGTGTITSRPWVGLNAQIRKVIIEEGITEIAEYVFMSQYMIEEVSLPSTLKTIGSCAFRDCDRLVSIIIPGSVEDLGFGSFRGCDRLESVTISEGLDFIEGESFYSCSNLKEVKIPKSVVTISSSAFEFCNELSKIYYAGSIQDWESVEMYPNKETLENVEIHCGEPETGVCGDNLTWEFDSTTLTISGEGDMYDYNLSTTIPPWFEFRGDIKELEIKEGVTSIGDCAFDGCENIVKVDIPKGVTRIGMSAFHTCPSIDDIRLPETVSVIEMAAFAKCKGIKELVIPNNVTSIGENAFAYCAGLEDVVIPEGVTTIEHGAFIGCNALTSVYIPDSVEFIGINTFSTCENLERVYIGSGIKEISVRAFFDCNKLTEIYYAGSESEWNEIIIGISNKPVELAEKTFDYDNSIAITSFELSEEGELLVKAQNMPSSTMIVAAMYDEEGRLLETVQLTLTDSGAGSEISTENVNTIKAFAWIGNSMLLPMCDAQVISVK